MNQMQERFTYSVPRNVRLQILHTLRQHRDGWMGGGGRFDFKTMVEEVGERCLAKYGRVLEAPYGEGTGIPFLDHFLLCSDKESLEYIEMCFQTHVMGGASEGAERAVAAINRIFEEESVGYELTRPQLIDTGQPGKLFGRHTGGNAFREELPRVVKKGDMDVHEKVVKPALGVLGDPRLATANHELLDAFEDVRNGDYADSITACGAAFESVLRTICTVKGWPFDPNKDACAALVETCRGNGLFFPCHVDAFKAVGIIRNKLGDAHGKGPKPAHVPKREHAEHMIAMTCAHIDFLVREAGF